MGRFGEPWKVKKSGDFISIVDKNEKSIIRKKQDNKSKEVLERIVSCVNEATVEIESVIKNTGDNYKAVSQKLIADVSGVLIKALKKYF